MMANFVTLIRLPLLAVIGYLLYQPSAPLQITAAFLILLLILLDSLDGMIARKYQMTSVLGSVLDIAADRTVELVLWVIFADLELVPVFIPLVVIARGVFVDAIRSVAPARGMAPFDLLRSKIGKFLVKSPFLRSPYGITKAVAFFMLALYSGLSINNSPHSMWVGMSSQVAVWIAFVLCIVRGVPVLIEAPRTLAEPI
jgi:CDP-diacylglycerol--glycerol-3-phosphate 3-phosphatidyltransferase